MHFPYGLRALNHRDFRLFWTAQLVSLIGSWMQSVGQAWLVLELTNSPFKLGLIGALQFTPVMLFSLAAGAVVDRLPKRRLLLVTQSILAVLALTLSALVWTGLIQYWHLAAMALVLGCVNTLDMPARQSYIVEMVGKDDLVNGIALNSAVFNGARMLGPAIAGLLIAKLGVAVAYFFNGISFIPVVFALLAIRSEGLPKALRGKNLVQEIGEGLRYVRRTPVTLLLLSSLFFVSLFVMNWNVLVPLLAKDVLHLEAEGFGLLMSSLGAGALLGSVALAFLGRKRPLLSVMMGAAALLGAVAFSIGFAKTLVPAAAALFICGVAQILFTASCNTTVQLTTPDELRGRIMSIYAMVFAGVAPLGSFTAGTITERFGASTGFLAGGSLGLTAILALSAWWLLRRRQTVTPEPAPHG